MQLTIRIGAAVDRSLSEAYRPLLAGAEKLRVGVEKSAKGAADAQVRAQKRVADSADREYAKAKATIDRWAAENARAADRAAKARAAAAERAAKAEATAAEKATRTQEREDAKRARSAQRAHAAAERSSAREANARDRQQLRATRARDRNHLAAARAARGALGNAASTAGSTIIGAGRMAGSFALDLARDVAMGAGVDLDLGSLMRKNSELESKTTDLSASGFMHGDARNGKRIDKRELAGDALRIGKLTGTDANDVVEGLQKFTGLTGDLQTGRELMQQLLMLSKATGSSFEDMAAAAANVANVLPETADKSKVIMQVMRAIAGQGKLGAVEIKDLAAQMAKLAAGAGAFGGDKAGTMIDLGALAQVARGKGGGASASQSVNAVQSFIGTFDKGAREKAFRSLGVETRDQKGRLMDPETLIKSALTAASAHGGPKAFANNMQRMFADKEARKAVKGFENIYLESGGGAAGLKAVSAEFERLRKATMSETEVMESFRRSMDTAHSQANVFNNTMRESAMTVQDSLTPVLLELAPRLAEIAKTGAGVTEWLLGMDAAARARNKAISNQVGSAHGETEKQIRNGFVFQQQLDLNADVEKQALLNMQRAKAEASVMNKDADYSGATKTALRIADAINPGNFLGDRISKWFGGSGTRGGGQLIMDAKDKEIGDRVDRATEAEAKWDEIHKANLRVGDLLSQGIIQVRVVEDQTKKPGDGKGIDLSGRDSGERPR